MTSQSSLYKTDAEGNVIQSGYPHIVFKNTGAPMIEGTRIKVQVIAIANQTWHLPPEGIKHEYPSLTLGEIHSALAYYWDHKDEIDQQIEDEKRFVDKMRRQNEPYQRELMRKIVERAEANGKAMRPVNQYTAITRQDGDWWIGWIEEVPGVTCQEATREELLETLRITLNEALEFNREDAIAAMEGDYQEERIVV